MTDRHRHPLGEVAAFLDRLHGSPVADLRPIAGGFWSSAYAYDHDDDRLVLRLGEDDAGYRTDRAAHRFASDDLPVPEVLDVGRAFDGAFAISRRADGRFLEDVGAGEVSQIAPLLDALLDALRRSAIDSPTVEWHRAESAEGVVTWRQWLREMLVDDGTGPTSGWAQQLATSPGPDALFRRVADRINGLLGACPERRDLVHGDLLHQNVLIDHSDARPTAVFSWKCSVLGDFLYDVAWCTFWAPWHPGIEAADPWPRLFDGRIDERDLVNADVRHHCYELHIGAQHLAWCAWTGNDDELAAVAARTEQVLHRGPRLPGH